jgi:ferrous iron transport protein B
MAIKSESGSWKWALFSAVYTTGVAWILAFAVYQIGGLFL